MNVQSVRLEEVLQVKFVNRGYQVQKSNSKNYWIDYYINGKRTRELIGRSKQAAENRLREVETAKAEGKHIKKNKSSMISLGEIYKRLSKTIPTFS